LLRWEIVQKGTVFIAEEMGVALKRSALSPNIRERLDHSCTVLNPHGLIVAQAEHIPVHLGSFKIGASNLLKWLKDKRVEVCQGDVILTNEPYISGTHLNDLMVLAPVFWHDELSAYVVNKAHHVDVGGPKPGSINPQAKTIEDEGIIIEPTKIVEDGKLVERVTQLIKTNFKAPQISLGDLQSQLASEKMGIDRVNEMFDKFGRDPVLEAWDKSIKYARKLTMDEMGNWPKKVIEAEDYLEWENRLIPLHARLWKTEDGIEVDFLKTSDQVCAPLNAVFGVTFSAVAFAIRSMISIDVPTNEGFYSTINAKARPGSLLNATKPAPVAGGNLETSQRIADLMFLALSEILPDKVPAAGSGTMMNLMMGGKGRNGIYWAYYETIGGGSGGRPRKPGVSGVHVNMTNTLNTPIEIAERMYPLFFTQYIIRSGSHGEGKYPGGDGIVRSFKTQLETEASILSDRFLKGPWGVKGGKPGAPGKVTVKRSNGRVEDLPSKATVRLFPEDEVVIETPGGGGWGK
jgi:N-methylhydantoinase B